MKDNNRKGDWEGYRRGTNLNEIKELKQQILDKQIQQRFYYSASI